MTFLGGRVLERGDVLAEARNLGCPVLVVGLEVGEGSLRGFKSRDSGGTGHEV